MSVGFLLTVISVLILKLVFHISGMDKPVKSTDEPTVKETNVANCDNRPVIVKVRRSSKATDAK